MKRALCLLLSLSLVSATVYAQEKPTKGKKAQETKTQKTKAGDLTDPLEILKKVDAAAKAVKAVKYDVTFESSGTNPRNPRTELKGSVIMGGEMIDFVPEKILVEVEIKGGDSDEVRRFSAGSDGEVFYFVDHQARKAYEDIDPAVMGSGARYFQPAVMIEFLHPTPFSDEINGKTRELKGSKVVNGEDCYEIHVVYAADNAPKAIWHFSKKDFLPRGRIDEYSGPGGNVVLKKVLAKLVVDPKLDEKTFKLKLPEGYTKTDDFAP